MFSLHSTKSTQNNDVHVHTTHISHIHAQRGHTHPSIYTYQIEKRVILFGDNLIHIRNVYFVVII